MVHISPANTVDGRDFGSNRFPNFQGVTLRHILAQVFDVNPVRILLPASLDDAKLYDVDIILPANESPAGPLVREIQDHFGIVIAREELLLDVYVVNTANGKAPAPLTQADDGFSFSRSGLIEFRQSAVEGWPDQVPQLKPANIEAIQAISFEGTMNEFCRTLELGLDCPLVNETNLEGEYEFRLKAAAGSENDFLERLRDQYNLNITPTERLVQMVVVKPR
jgi:uncharacterized protein (TIGR03435 family)